MISHFILFVILNVELASAFCPMNMSPSKAPAITLRCFGLPML